MFYDDLSNYMEQLPERLRGIVEIDAIAGSVDFEVDKLSGAIKNAVNNKFPSTADKDGCARWEKILAISQVIDQFKNNSVSGNPIAMENLLAPVTVTKAQITGHANQTATEQGKNLWDVKNGDGSVTIFGIQFSLGTDGKVTISGTSTANIYYNLTKHENGSGIRLAAGTYTVSLSNPINGFRAAIYCAVKDIDGNNLSNIALSHDSSTFTINTNAYFTCYLNIPNGKTADAAIGFQLESGSAATAYEPFVPDSPSPDYPAPITGANALTVSDGGSNSQVIALPQPLYSLPDGTIDSYDVVSGNGTKNIALSLEDGSKSWTFYNTGDSGHSTAYFASGTRISSPKYNNAICSHFVMVDGAKLWTTGFDKEAAGMDITFGGLRLRILKSRLPGWSDSWTNAQKVTALKAWLAANPVTVLYQLATPKAISGEAQQISGYARLIMLSANAGSISATLRSYDPETTLQARRDAIRSTLMSQPPINLNALKAIVEAYMGLEVDVSLDGYQVHIRYRGESKIPDLNPLYVTMWKTIPANILVDIAYLWAAWEEVKASYPTWGEMKTKTWEQIHKGE